MKVNGKRRSVYKDKIGPYDGYYSHGNIYDECPEHYKVVRAFDMDGDHIGILRHKFPKSIIFLLVLTILVGAIMIGYISIYPHSESIIIYKASSYLLDDEGCIHLKIKNMNIDDLYIIIGEDVYTVSSNQYIEKLPLNGNTKIYFKYHNAMSVEEIVFD